MPGQGRLGDKANVPLDAHGCPACPHPAVGPAIRGSPDVNVNGRPALRVDDPGIHAACCGKNTWTATKGSLTVFINGKGAHRLGDENRHCGGLGQLIEGSPNVMVGESTNVVAAASRQASATEVYRTPAYASGPASSPATPPPSAEAAEPADADSTLDPELDLDPAAIHVQAQANALRAAAAAHIPFCEACERAQRASQARPASPR